jgi:hypothetical protein
MAHPDQNGDGTRWQAATPVTQAERGMWQRQGARTLAAIVERHHDLPAIRWAISRNGGVYGQVIGQSSPAGTLAAFTRWRDALGVQDSSELAGTSGFTHFRARMDWGATRITLAATVPGDRMQARWYARRGPGNAEGYQARQAIAGARHLGRILDTHCDLEALAWTIRPSGQLLGSVGQQRSASATWAILQEWQRGLGLKAGPETTDGAATGRAAFTREAGVFVAVRATVISRFPRPGGQGPSSAERRGPVQRP